MSRPLTPTRTWCLLALALLCVSATHASSPTTLTVGYFHEPASLNPLTITSAEARDIVERLFVKLLEEQGDFLTFKPRLARSWEYSADSLSITFHLRDDVRWSDGMPVTARDVRFTYELQMDTTVAWPDRDIKEDIRDVEVIDDHTVAFRFAERYPYQLMDANDGVILPMHLLADIPRTDLRNHPFGRAPVGNGPYVLKRWESARYIELVANEDYYEGPPTVDHIVFTFVPDMVSLMTQLKKGEIDLLESVPLDQQPALTRSYPGVTLYRYPSRRIDSIAWNQRRDLLADRAVRRALTMAIDRREVIATIWGENARESNGPILPLLWAYDPGIEPIPFDPTRARAALESLGWRDGDGDGVLERDGRKFAFEIMTNNSNQLRIDICTMVQNYLGRIGVDVKIRTFDFPTYLDRLLEGDYDAAVAQLKVSTKLDISDRWHSKAVPPGGYNVSCYQNPEVDRLMEEARVCLDPERARVLWQRVQRIIYDDQPFTFVAVPDEVNALSARFCNVEPNAISFFANLRYWKVAPDCE